MITYRQRSLVYTDEAYNLPIDVIYFVESDWNYRLNDYVRNHRQEIEDYINREMADRLILPYRLEYVSRQSSVLYERLTPLHPELQDVYIDFFPLTEHYYESIFEDNLQAKKEQQWFTDSFIARYYPTGSDEYWFNAFDAELLDPEDVLSALCNFVAEQYTSNQHILNGGSINLSGELCPTESSYIAGLGQPCRNWKEEESKESCPDICFCFESDEEPTSPSPEPTSPLNSSEASSKLPSAIGQEPTPSSSPLNSSEASSKLPSSTPDVRFSIASPKRRFKLAPEPASPLNSSEASSKLPSAIGQEPTPSSSPLNCSEASSKLPSASPALLAKALAIKAEIDALQRDGGLNILYEVMGANLIDTLRASSPVVISPLQVDSQFRILLPVYDREIPLHTLPKALYILFLRHPEGIERMCLDDHRDELRTIYLTISSRSDMEAINRSINDLVEPGSTSLDQKVSRINAAFRKTLANDLALNYMIAGPRGEAKRILVASSALLPDELRF